MPSMTPPQPPTSDRLNVARDVVAAILCVIGVGGVGVTLYFIAPLACLLYGFGVVTVTGFVLASGVGR